MTGNFEIGDRVVVTCFGEPRHGKYGTVTRAPYAGVMTERLMVDVLFDGELLHQDEGVYVQNLELAHLTAVA